MKKLIQVIDFIEDFMRWARRRRDIRAVALVGSYARLQANPASDVDLVVIVNDPQKYLTQTEWLRNFGVVITKQIEEYGKLTSLRAWYESGLEIEYGFTTREWIAAPLDAGTKRVIKNGLRVLFEKEVLLSPYESKPEAGRSRVRKA
ncbi:MAG: aminoglycoside 6-adenylyltransferase [Chloroflexota bacterium]|nr:aminoglycoside 6-adenylyltransferase [Chloroflexota bacterium]MBI5701934.1 aminoglycoside 6-adenylyltransferase [Chloroflexota bacterium]